MTAPEELEAELRRRLDAFTYPSFDRDSVSALLDNIAALQAERDEARKETKLRQAALTARARSMSKLRARLVQITDHIEDEGDRRYFGSTNHADELMEIFHDLDAWNWEEITSDGKLPDPYETSRKAISRAEAAEAREGKLRAALMNIAHTFTEDSHGGMKTMPATYYQELARAAREEKP